MHLQLPGALVALLHRQHLRFASPGANPHQQVNLQGATTETESGPTEQTEDRRQQVSQLFSRKPHPAMTSQEKLRNDRFNNDEYLLSCWGPDGNVHGALGDRRAQGALVEAQLVQNSLQLDTCACAHVYYCPGWWQGKAGWSQTGR